MSSRSIAGPEAKPAAIFDRRGEVRVTFLGRFEGFSTRPSTVEAAQQAFAAICTNDAANVVVNRQVHSDRIVPIEAAPAEADGLFDDASSGGEASAETVTALTVFTADCVPVLLGRPGGPIAALHAGWRGLAHGIIGHGVARFADPAKVAAWIGPCIGACCYEVDDQVALSVARTCDASVIRPGHQLRPHLDLERAAQLQLQAGGIRDVRVLRCCTRCDPSWHSYRREGAGQGRNHAFIWREAASVRRRG